MSDMKKTLGGGVVILVLVVMGMKLINAETRETKAKQDVRHQEFKRSFAKAWGDDEAASEAEADIKSAKTAYQKAAGKAEKVASQAEAQQDAILNQANKQLKEESEGELDLEEAMKKVK